ncbi:MAG: Crp/Fnr family transcriptional regulator [Spirulina sp.]
MGLDSERWIAGDRLGESHDACLTVHGSSRIQTFKTGFDIFDYQVPPWAETLPTAEDYSPSAYFVVRGRVRILGQSQRRARPYSAALLHPGDFFGADHLFYAAPLSYRAVAASSCQVLQIPCSHLALWADQFPGLAAHWGRCIEQRVQQVFFKRFTPLQTLPTHVLSTQLISQIQELQVDCGTPLAAAVHPYQGYFWLRSGHLVGPSASHPSPVLGQGWSSDHCPWPEGVAQTPVRLLHLGASRAREAADLLPVLNPLSLRS